MQKLEQLVDTMTHGTDDEASTILAQLRLGDTVDEILGVDMDEDLSGIGDADKRNQ